MAIKISQEWQPGGANGRVEATRALEWPETNMLKAAEPRFHDSLNFAKPKYGIKLWQWKKFSFEKPQMWQKGFDMRKAIYPHRGIDCLQSSLADHVAVWKWAATIRHDIILHMEEKVKPRANSKLMQNSQELLCARIQSTCWASPHEIEKPADNCWKLQW